MAEQGSQAEGQSAAHVDGPVVDLVLVAGRPHGDGAASPNTVRAIPRPKDPKVTELLRSVWQELPRLLNVSAEALRRDGVILAFAEANEEPEIGDITASAKRAYDTTVNCCPGNPPPPPPPGGGPGGGPPRP